MAKEIKFGVEARSALEAGVYLLLTGGQIPHGI